MTSIDFNKAKIQFSRLGKLAEDGETTIILKHKSPSFVIAPLPSSAKPRLKKPGIALGKGWMAPDFNLTPVETILEFEGK